MKKQPENHEKSDVSCLGQRPMKKKKKRLGGKGLSLEAFANAKSNNNHYNPSLIKKQRELNKNAKYISKYKKSLKYQSMPQNHISTTESITEDGNGVKEGRKMKNSLQNVREEYEKRRLEEEKVRREREAIAQAKKEEIKKSEARRRAMREKMLKKTAHGQPVMKYRLEHLLQNIQGSAN